MYNKYTSLLKYKLAIMKSNSQVLPNLGKYLYETLMAKLYIVCRFFRDKESTL